MTVLSAFDENHTAVNLSDVARRAGLPLSTTHRVLGEFERGQFVARAADGSFAVGEELSRLGRRAPEHGGGQDEDPVPLTAPAFSTEHCEALTV
ncbi:helix-turn-helix domain-containing protein [Micromonospora sp. KC606]|uniref:helix-turn-helix domain-containing protein n=1 Tax=Micromonospora sp. KC606 TaxID=2530379 RepID=UPI001404E4AE|nr:helix-turn-helix domain-containing protein [Micromonospora sp. KC606]